MKKIYFLSALMALSTIRVWASYDGIAESFGPFRDAEKIEKVSLKELVMLESSQAETTMTQKWGLKEDAQAPTWLVRTDIKDPKNPSNLFQLARYSKRKTLKFELKGKDFQNLFSSDFNGDNLPDFVLTLVNQSQKKAASEEEDRDGISLNRECFVVLLSNKKTYRAFLVESAHFSEWGLYQLGSPKRAVFLHTVDFKETNSSASSETRVIFHLYQLLSVKGSDLIVDNGLENRFPKFVAQDFAATHKNHKETKLLTDARKKELLNLNQPKIIELKFIK